MSGIVYVIGPWLPPDASAASEVMRRLESARPGKGGTMPRRYTNIILSLGIGISGGDNFRWDNCKVDLHWQWRRCDFKELDAEELLIAGDVAESCAVVAGDSLCCRCH